MHLADADLARRSPTACSPSKKRRYTIVLLRARAAPRASRSPRPGRRPRRSSVVELAEALRRARARLVVGPAGVDRREPVEAAGLHALEHVLLEHAGAFGDLGRRRRPAELLAERRSPCGRARGAAPGRGAGTRTAHPRSRKWRLSSPVMVGVANDENCSPRSGSKRSTALSSPTSATWRRSSSGSPRCAKRRARNSARRTCSSTSSLRRARSPRAAVLLELLVGVGRVAHRSGRAARASFITANPSLVVAVGELVVVGDGVDDGA